MISYEINKKCPKRYPKIEKAIIKIEKQLQVFQFGSKQQHMSTHTTIR